MTTFPYAFALALVAGTAACSPRTPPSPQAEGTKVDEASHRAVQAANKKADTPLAQAEGWHTIEVKEENYELTLEWPQSSPNGQVSEMRVGITPLEPWHMNMEYPMSLSFEEHPDVELGKLELGVKDAVEHSERGTGFEISYTPRKSGTTAVKGKLKFAVCAKEQCMPMNVPVRLDLSVGAV